MHERPIDPPVGLLSEAFAPHHANVGKRPSAKSGGRS
ncbi:hypothetical protein C7450_101508 [Chelatococcus asaccharovorans]|uniref:Uncharacterized protein n=1 Tax=Chelatococcus asaccharovorans TaxID=28210 RepID=A0A2V3UHY5_9HYPH|nr:hypothetical protein C7450_101508 [Chelatococcus asaccharovorans]